MNYRVISQVKSVKVFQNKYLYILIFHENKFNYYLFAANSMAEPGTGRGGHNNGSFHSQEISFACLHIKSYLPTSKDQLYRPNKMQKLKLQGLPW